jgi:hypothetical protein
LIVCPENFFFVPSKLLIHPLGTKYVLNFHHGVHIMGINYCVISYSSVISLIKLSINMAVFGSKPELGSSQNRYLGLLTIARAIATRFAFLQKFEKVVYYERLLRPLFLEQSQLALKYRFVVVSEHFQWERDVFLDSHRIKALP